MGCFECLSHLKHHFARLRPGRSRTRELNIVRPISLVAFDVRTISDLSLRGSLLPSEKIQTRATMVITWVILSPV